MARWTDQRQPGRRDPSPELAAAIRLAAAQRAQQGPRANRRRGGVTHRLRRQLAPWYIATGLVALAGLGNVLGWLGVNAHVVVQFATTLSVGSVVVAALVVLKKVPAHWRVRASTAVVSGAAWLPWAAEAMTWAKLLVFVPAFYATKARHDRHVRIPEPVAKPDPKDATPATTQERWAAYVGGEGYSLAGAQLRNGRIEVNGDARVEVFDGLWVRGKQTLDEALAALPKIESGLGYPRKDLMLDRHPTDSDPAAFVFKRILTSPINEPVYYTGPRYRDGKALIGPYADGIGMAPYTLYIRKRMRNGMVIGQTGSGKSRMMDIISLAPRAEGHTVLINVDGQDGMSSPTLAKEALHFCPLDGAGMALAGFKAIQQHRQRRMSDLGRNGFTPSREFPGILIVKDEVHKIYTQANAEEWADLAREFNKVGMGFLDGDQDSTLETFRKGVLRDSLQAGNTIGLRTANRDAGQILHEGKFNLRDLPDIPGFAYTLNTGGECRTAPFRGEFLPDLDDRLEGAVPPDVETVDEWYRKIPGIPLDEGSEAAWQSVMSGAGTAEPMGSSVTAAAGSGAVILSFPDPVQFADDAATAGASAGTGRSLSNRDRVRAALLSGARTHREVQEATGLSTRHVRNLLGELVEAGVLSKVNKNGVYALVVEAAAGEATA